MSDREPSSSAEMKLSSQPAARASFVAFVAGVPLAAAVLCFIYLGPLKDTPVRRYVNHPVECVEVILFCIALAALGAKLLNNWTERRSCRLEVVPPWNGRPVEVREARSLLGSLQELPRRLGETQKVRRTTAILDFLARRGSAAELDDQLRCLADNDAIALEGSYALTRIITWAIPILGFLGTVLGITGAISGVTPEVLENSLSTVTDGLALAFDTTALALGLTMVTMFASFIVERGEQSVLDRVDRYVERELAHRFERVSTGADEFVGVVRRNSDVLLEAMEKLVRQQTDLWSRTIQETEERRHEAEKKMQDRLSASLEKALERTMEAHSRQLLALEKQFVEHSSGLVSQLTGLATAVREAGREQQSSLAQVTQGVGAQVEALARLQEGDKHIRRLQETLNQNLATLAGSGTFEQALHSLTAAIHLLTARSPVAGGPHRIINRPGAAA